MIDEHDEVPNTKSIPEGKIFDFRFLISDFTWYSVKSRKSKIENPQ